MVGIHVLVLVLSRPALFNPGGTASYNREFLLPPPRIALGEAQLLEFGQIGHLVLVLAAHDSEVALACPNPVRAKLFLR